MWSHVICDTVTGDRLANVEASDGSFQRLLNDSGEGSATFVTSAIGAGSTAAARRASRLDLLTPWKRTIVQCWDGEPQYAGLIEKPAPDFDAGKVVVQTTDMRALTKKRTTLGANGYDANGKYHLSYISLLSAGGLLAQLATVGPDSSWSLPFVYPPLDIGDKYFFTWQDWNLPVIDTELGTIHDLATGPDVDFDPQWDPDTGKLQWLVRSGRLKGDRLEYNLDAQFPQLTGVGYADDASKMATAVYAVGNGSEADLLVRTARATTDGPALEVVQSYTQESDGDLLQEHADSDLATFSTPTRQFSLSMQANDVPGVNDLTLGGRIRLHTKDHDWLDDGWSDTRLIGYSGDLSNTIKLQVQPQPAGDD